MPFDRIPTPPPTQPTNIPYVSSPPLSEDEEMEERPNSNEPPQTQKPSSDIRSSTYAPEDASFYIFKAGNRLFRLPIWSLAKHSDVFGGLRTLPGDSRTAEGQCDGCPIILNDSEEDFECFIEWWLLYKYPLTQKQWISVLAISKKYFIEAAATQALEHLRFPLDHSKFEPAFKLRLAWEFEIEDWYAECIRDMLTIPFAEFSPHDVRDLEPVLTTAFLAIRSKCFRQRLELIPYLPQGLHHISCTEHSRCIRDWQSAYGSAMLFFASTRKFFSGREIFKRLSDVDVPSFNPECRMLNLAKLEESGILWREEHFIEKGEEQLLQLIKSIRPLSPRPKEPRFLPPDYKPSLAGQYQF